MSALEEFFSCCLLITARVTLKVFTTECILHIFSREWSIFTPYYMFVSNIRSNLRNFPLICCIAGKLFRRHLDSVHDTACIEYRKSYPNALAIQRLHVFLCSFDWQHVRRHWARWTAVARGSEFRCFIV